MSKYPRWRHAVTAPRTVPAAARHPSPAGPARRVLASCVAAAAMACAAHAQGDAPAGGPPLAVANSTLDAPLFYQLIIGEMELASGQAGTAFEIVLDAARRTRDENVFRRAVDIALQGRAGDQALAATRAWRQALPESLNAVRMEVQILSALNRLGDAAEPLGALVRLTPPADRAALIAAMPRALQRSPDKKRAAQILDEVLAPYLRDRALAVPALVASGRGWLAAGDADRALALAQQSHQREPSAPGPVLLAMELMTTRPQAERLVTQHLDTGQPESAMRLAYVRVLTGSQRYADAVRQLELVTREKPELAPPWLTLGALHLDMRHFQEADSALQRYVQLAQSQAQATRPDKPAAAAAGEDDDEDEDAGDRPDQGVVEAWLLLARSAEQRGDFAGAEAWLKKIEDPRRALEVQARRATLLARQGRLDEARNTLRLAPERNAEDARAKLLAEASMLRDVKRWGDAYTVLEGAAQRFSGDPDLLYEQAMMAEKLNRLDDAERLLRKVIELKPDNAHAFNALGYSLADRGVRLPEARQLIQRALELSPGDPFITDSLGWVEYRMGNLDEALRLLRRAYAARPDTEIGAHLGEVLWAAGQRDEARRIWREARARDDGNEALRETLARLKVDL